MAFRISSWCQLLLTCFYLITWSFRFPILSRRQLPAAQSDETKEEHLVPRPFSFLVFVTVRQLNLDQSALAPGASAVDGSVPYALMNATWKSFQKGACYLFVKNVFSVVLYLRQRRMWYNVSPSVLVQITALENNWKQTTLSDKQQFKWRHFGKGFNWNASKNNNACNCRVVATAWRPLLPNLQASR